ncbi:MAG: permease-like cell division protein FtsX, partial [Burkholderiaceae bacterium]|nr:permease-like cell division protein FtsX [Burkholderiaceae bacterium]
FNILVLSLTLTLPFAGVTLLENLQTLTGRMAVEPEISVFLKNSIPREEAQTLETAIRQMLRSDENPAKIAFIPREKALENLERQRGDMTNIIKTLGKNPLPDGYLISIAGNDGDPRFTRHIEHLAKQLETLPQVQKVQIDSAWIKRLAALVRVARMCILILGIGLGIVVIAVIFNTIRLQVLTRIDEITLTRMVGATRAYIRRPFYYTGILLGLVSGALALGLVVLALYPLNGVIADLARLYATDLRLSPPLPHTAAALLAISAALGWIGALFSVNRHLGRIS